MKSRGQIEGGGAECHRGAQKHSGEVWHILFRFYVFIYFCGSRNCTESTVLFKQRPERLTEAKLEPEIGKLLSKGRLGSFSVGAFISHLLFQLFKFVLFCADNL